MRDPEARGLGPKVRETLLAAFGATLVIVAYMLWGHANLPFHNGMQGEARAQIQQLKDSLGDDLSEVKITLAEVRVELKAMRQDRETLGETMRSIQYSIREIELRQAGLEVQP